jgi:hypothetical protein
VEKKEGIPARLLSSLRRFGNMFSINEEVNPMKPITSKERKKRNKIQKMKAESRRIDRPVKNNLPVPKPRKKRYL